MTATETFIANYGLFAVFIGGLLEGETILILAAVAAHHGLLSLPAVFVFAASAATISDQGLFMIARYKSDSAMVRRLMARPGVRRALDRVHRHPRAFVLSFRFIYGLRIAGAIACGLSRIPAPQFIVLNLIAAMIWAAVILCLGYTFGSAVGAVLGTVARLEWKLIAALATLAAIFVVGHRLYTRRNT